MLATLFAAGQPTRPRRHGYDAETDESYRQEAGLTRCATTRPGAHIASRCDERAAAVWMQPWIPCHECKWSASWHTLESALEMLGKALGKQTSLASLHLGVT
eukprot:6077568-Prymnesium_polylepis.1